ncbi:benzoyl-CoA reductase/2-hydroxyglutaryl-CoA dehydratase subunit BcrC/BadD/HgdB [Muricomes intestini]|uniref:Benzoyl-CoA reductase/2-hydroxyglutaryl-CoA dehydratase subunit BcrC/BadD/HgdB n=1 Tax=Muricomes intestini TaxID=1796634 RepID=A0A4R3K5L8_9FIRM|nr:double-cubane-cluster-containing anaerobic reductase [Muricomes intestini]TCS78069.1 benzoyl-CoA reductase/2-hydroxyglutaryl-CoA dehydratase subunit BcrC/BadD/HgdB [Muricomes intestini]
MEVKKNLPEIFEDFAEARQAAFLNVKKIKDQDKPVIGVFCTFFPQELAVAMNAAVVSLCATSDETIAAAEQDLPKNLCPLIKSSYGFGKTDKCPFFYFSDLVVGETTCDGKKKMYEYLEEFKPVHVMELPNRVSEDGIKSFRKEIIRMKEKLEEVFYIEITEEDIRRGIRVKNAERTAIKQLYSIMKEDPVPISGLDLLNTLVGITFNFDREGIPAQMEELINKIKSEGSTREKRPRILVTGCPMGGATLKVVKAIEENGGIVVAYENCTGAKAIEENVDEAIEDVYEALSRKYMNIGCACMSPNENRIKLLDQMIDEYKVDAVVDMELQACQPYTVESMKIKRFVNEEKKIPYISIETDYSQADIAQITTRIAAFIEML